MSARITPRATSAGHASALEAAFGPCAHMVYRILLEQKRPPDTWRAFQNLDVANDPERPVAPDELVSECLAYMRAEQDERGEAKFRISAFGPGEKPNSEVRHFILETGLDPPATADQRATAETNALVETNALLRHLLADEHKAKMEMFRISIEVPKTVVEVVKVMPEAMGKTTAHYEVMGKALGYAYMDKQEERESRERSEDNKMRFAAIDRALEKLEPLGMMFLAKIMADAGIPMPGTEAANAGGGEATATVVQEPSRKAQEIKRFCEKLTREERIKLIEAFGDDGDDALAVLFGAGEAPTDQACDACLRKLKELLAGRDAMWLVMTVRGIVGDRVIPLAPIFKPIWEER